MASFRKAYRALTGLPIFLWRKWGDRRANGLGLPPLSDWLPMLRRVLASYYPLEAAGLRTKSLSSGRGGMLEAVYDQFLLAAQGRGPKNSRPLDYVARSTDSLDASRLAVKAVAFYLPQFYPIPENDLWWGPGFTEWTNVSKAVPQFVGQHQPHLPDELGFYDLRVPEVMRQQAKMARHYGLHAFCFYHYWFGGKPLLERPLAQFLADPSIEINFCLCWANENWTRAWEGAKAQVLMDQTYSADNDRAFLESVLPALKDPRYLRVDGKPLLMVYRPGDLPDAKATAARWRAQAVEAGLPGLYLVVAKSFTTTDPRPYGFDAAAEFPPHQVIPKEVSANEQILNTAYRGHIYSYEEMAREYAARGESEFPNFKTVMPSWDNEARRPGAGTSFVGSTPARYAAWLGAACEAAQPLRDEERLVFINAWNEWAEGAHLEPDRKHGFAYLHATANVLRRYYRDPERAAFIAQCNAEFKKSSDTALVFHCHYEDVFAPLAQKYLAGLKGEADLFLSFRPDIGLAMLRQAKELFPNIRFVPVENRGRDIRPFLKLLPDLKGYGYAQGCKIHSKKSLHLSPGRGEDWRDTLCGPLLGGPGVLARASKAFAADKNLGLLVPEGSQLDCADPRRMGNNRRWLDILLKKLGKPGLAETYDFSYPAGSMYWFRLEALEGLDALVLACGEFEDEAGQVDGTLAHAVERFVGVYALSRGFQMRQVDWAS